VLAQTVGLFTGDQYTHSALALDEGLEYMFSFGRRRARNPFIGCFKHESLDDDLYSGYSFLPGAVIQLPVSPEQYLGVTTQLWNFLLDGHTFSYNVYGLIGNMVGKGKERPARFFCSEFVYHILYESGVCDVRRPRYMVRPQDLMGLGLTELGGTLIFEGDLKTYRSSRSTSLRTNPSSMPFNSLVQELSSKSRVAGE
jgi:hypothetical protein